MEDDDGTECDYVPNVDFHVFRTLHMNIGNDQVRGIESHDPTIVLANQNVFHIEHTANDAY